MVFYTPHPKNVFELAFFYTLPGQAARTKLDNLHCVILFKHRPLMGPSDYGVIRLSFIHFPRRPDVRGGGGEWCSRVSVNGAVPLPELFLKKV